MGISGLSSYPLQQSGEKALSSSNQDLSPQEPPESANHAYETSPLVLHEFLQSENPIESPAFLTNQARQYKLIGEGRREGDTSILTNIRTNR